MFQHKSAPFKVANMYGWMVILSNRKHIEELRRAPDDELSFMEAASNVSNCPILLELDRTKCHRQILNSRYMLGDEVHDTPYHVAVVRSQLTRNIGKMYPEIRDEVVTAFDEVLDLRGYGGESFFTRACLALISGTFRMEECTGIRRHPKGCLQDKQQTVRRPPIVYVFLPLVPSLHFLIHHSRPQPRLGRSQHPVPP
jgi:hypothetical protein